MTREDWFRAGNVAMTTRIAAGGTWSISAACPRYHDSWQRTAWLDGAWAALQSARAARKDGS